MDTEVEVTRRGNGFSVIVGDDSVMVLEREIGGAVPAYHITLDHARLIAKAIADYDRAVAAVGGGE